jgi:hypothetical protein
MFSYFVVQTFQRGRRGELVADPAMLMPNAHQAERTARRLAETRAGAIAFSRTGDADTGDFEDPTILCMLGDLPDEIRQAA